MRGHVFLLTGRIARYQTNGGRSVAEAQRSTKSESRSDYGDAIFWRLFQPFKGLTRCRRRPSPERYSEVLHLRIDAPDCRQCARPHANVAARNGFSSVAERERRQRVAGFDEVESRSGWWRRSRFLRAFFQFSKRAVSEAAKFGRGGFRSSWCSWCVGCIDLQQLVSGAHPTHRCRQQPYGLITRSMPFARRFPPPWTLDEHNDARFIVKDATGQALAYFSRCTKLGGQI